MLTEQAAVIGRCRRSGSVPPPGIAAGAGSRPGPKPSRLRSGAAASSPTSAKATAGPPWARSGRVKCGGVPTVTSGRARSCRCAPSARQDAWCEDPASRHYNQPIRLDGGCPGDRLTRDDHLYDFIVEIDHNIWPRIAGRGSAVFLHLARENFAPTAGCVSMTASAMLRLLARLGPETRIVIG